MILTRLIALVLNQKSVIILKMNAKLSLLEFVGLIPCDRQRTVSLYHCNPQSPYTLNKQLYFTIIITHFCGDGMIQHDDMSSTIKIF